MSELLQWIVVGVIIALAVLITVVGHRRRNKNHCEWTSCDGCPLGNSCTNNKRNSK